MNVALFMALFLDCFSVYKLWEHVATIHIILVKYIGRIVLTFFNNIATYNSWCLLSNYFVVVLISFVSHTSGVFLANNIWELFQLFVFLRMSEENDAQSVIFKHSWHLHLQALAKHVVITDVTMGTYCRQPWCQRDYHYIKYLN